MVTSDVAPLFLAPLHGITNRYYRTAWAETFQDLDSGHPAFDLAVAPFIVAVADARADGPHFRELKDGPREAIPLVPQLLGSDPKSLADSARALVELGCREINWNLGCPFPMVVRKKRGAGLLPHPDLVERGLDALCAVPQAVISVKLRLGLSSLDELGPILTLLGRYPLERVIMHPRLGVDMYRGNVRLEGFARSVELCAHPLVYNGDILSASDHAAILTRFPRVAGCMLGRGVLRDPFLPLAIKSPGSLPSLKDRLSLVRDFHARLYALYRANLAGPSHALDKMKEVWSYLGPSLSGVDRELEALRRTRSTHEYEGTVRRIFRVADWIGCDSNTRA